MKPVERKYDVFTCRCGAEAVKIRTFDTLRSCPWSLTAHMVCIVCGDEWMTYLYDSSRMTPYDEEYEETCARCGRNPPYRDYDWCLSCRPELEEDE